jgi:hypothetical protein
VRRHGNDNVLGQGAPVDRQMLRRRSGGFLQIERQRHGVPVVERRHGDLVLLHRRSLSLPSAGNPFGVRQYVVDGADSATIEPAAPAATAAVQERCPTPQERAFAAGQDVVECAGCHSSMMACVPLFTPHTCSKTCEQANRRRRLPPRLPLPEQDCAHCGRPFRPRRKGVVLYCSTPCRTRAKDDRRLAAAQGEAVDRPVRAHGPA